MNKKKCNNCFCFDREKKVCKVNIIYNGKNLNMPVAASDDCHYIELGVSVEQVRFWEEEAKGKKVVKMEYPENFFGKNLNSALDPV
jgi:hypothetical protein